LKGNFGDLDVLLVEARIPYADAILFDLGVSSPQIDVAERGFSFKVDAPLDMRMDPGRQTLTAAEVIATYTEADLTRIIRDYGEDRWASRIASFVAAARARRPISTTGDLVEVIKAAVPAAARRSGGHPAKKTFQALRIEVNGELDALERGLSSAISWLAPGGRVAVISYHSLEDRMVKRAFAQYAQGCTCPPGLPVCTCGSEPVVDIVTKRAIVPSSDEIEKNPRARSAKLRVAEKK
jgi:16S rRNA (cytosine1402-N4)-methyltransferase